MSVIGFWVKLSYYLIGYLCLVCPLEIKPQLAETKLIVHNRKKRLAKQENTNWDFAKHTES